MLDKNLADVTGADPRGLETPDEDLDDLPEPAPLMPVAASA